MKHAPLKDSNINTFNNDSDEIDIGKLFRFVLIQSKLVILITVLGFMAALANNFLSTKQFSIQSLLQYESVNQIFSIQHLVSSHLLMVPTQIYQI